MPKHHLLPSGVRKLLSASVARIFGAIGILAAFASLTGCSLFASADHGQTDTVPLPSRGDLSAYDSPGESSATGVESPSSPVDRGPGMGWAQKSTGDDSATASVGSGDPKDPKTAGTKAEDEPISESGGFSAAWSTPKVKSPIRHDEIPAPTKPGSGSVLEVPVPNSPIVETEQSRPLLPLGEFRKRVFAIQQKEEADRFRDAIHGPEPAGESDNDQDEKIGALSLDADDLTPTAGEAPVPRAEPAEEKPKSISADSPRVKAAYQVYRWNLMETLAGAERAYWKLHFTDKQFSELEQSLNHLAGINDKARIGVLRKTRSASDIVATETLRSHRRIAVAEADARRTVAMSELASYYTAYSSDGSSVTSRPKGLVRTEAPAKANPSTDAAALIGRADKVHPLYIAERNRGGDDDPDPDAAPSSHIKERIEGSLDRFRAARENVGNTRSRIDMFSSAYDENLRNFGNGKIDLSGITTFEKSYLTARQNHLDALLDYQNSLIDLELEVGDFLENRGQEIPLSDLLED